MLQFSSREVLILPYHAGATLSYSNRARPSSTRAHSLEIDFYDRDHRKHFVDDLLSYAPGHFRNILVTMLVIAAHHSPRRPRNPHHR